MQEIVKKVHREKALKRMLFWAIIKKPKEGKLAAADQRHPCVQTFIADIAAKVENDQRNPRLGSWGDDQNVSPTLSKDLKLSQKSARWWRQLKEKEMKKERVLARKAFVARFLRQLRQRSHYWWVGRRRRERCPASPSPTRPPRRIRRGLREIAQRWTSPRRSGGDTSAAKGISRSAVGPSKKA